jgi:transcriptional regulator with XRE-family HTH domain
VILSKSKNNFKEVYIMEVGERIKLRREELNMTQEELAQKVGYTSRSSIAKIESNANGMLQSKLNLFAEALQTTPSYLIGWEEIDEETEKKNDTIADIILKLRIDDELFKMVQALSELSSEQRTAVKSILSAFISTK